MQLGHVNQAFIKTMSERDHYQYLGVFQLKGRLKSAMKKSLLESFSKRLSCIKAINSYPIPLLAYSFELTKWSNTDLETINRTIRTEMTGHRMHHRGSEIKRIVLPCLKGGRSVLDVRQLCATHVSQLRKYFYHKMHVPLYDNSCRKNNRYTFLNLAAH